MANIISAFLIILYDKGGIIFLTVLAVLGILLIMYVSVYGRNEEFKDLSKNFRFNKNDIEYQKLKEEFSYVNSRSFYRKTYIEYSKGIKTINYGLSDPRYLDTLVLPDSLETISSYAFEKCDNLEFVFIPKNVKNIATTAFIGCEKLSRFAVDKHNQKYGSVNGMIYDIKELKIHRAPCGIGGSISETLIIPKGIISIGENSFEDCKKLYFVELPETLKNIEDSAFFSCEMLLKIHIPKKVESIGEYAFCGCFCMTEVIIEGTPVIGKHAFHKCLALRVVRFMQRLEPSCYSDAFSEEDYEFIRLEVPEADLAYYKETSCFKKIVPF